jgi:hypothetical protein
VGRFDLNLHFFRFEDTDLTVACYTQGSYGRFALLLVMHVIVSAVVYMIAVIFVLSAYCSRVLAECICDVF